jgi:hypothetical protein
MGRRIDAMGYGACKQRFARPVKSNGAPMVLLLVALLGAPSTNSVAANVLATEISPTELDPRITRFNEPNLVLFDRDHHSSPNLVVFLPGTDGAPRKYEMLLTVLASRGFHVIGLEYNDSPAVIQVCGRVPRPSCSGDFREQRAFGDNSSSEVDGGPEESIVGRLTSLLVYLVKHNHDEHWDRYLVDKTPYWKNIIISGFSQGAGMAAYIAKRERVARVVMFSGPWDYTGSTAELAPWLSKSSATEPVRWFASFHKREDTAAEISRAYQELRIPREHVRIFNLDLQSSIGTRARNPFHVSTVRNAAYEEDWLSMFGLPN